MQLDDEFVRLPLRFDAGRLAFEVRAFAESDWRKHPQGHAGNSALPLVAAGGDAANDDVRGPMLPTPHLKRCPYLWQVLASLKTVIGRTRLMRIEGNGEATAHTDTNYYWMNRVRIHVPIITFPTVDFLCGETTVNMPEGECWIFDTWRMHNVLNRQPEARIHLVSDSVGSVDFWKLVEQGDRPGDAAFSRPSTARMLEFDPSTTPPLLFEAVNFPVVMSPGEQDQLVGWLFGQVDQSAPESLLASLRGVITQFQWQWKALWAQYGTSPLGFGEYREALRQIEAELKPHTNAVKLQNRADLVEGLRQAIVRPALNPDLAEASSVPTSVPASALPTKPLAAAPAASSIGTAVSPSSLDSNGARATSGSSRFDRPVFIVSAPRSGSSLLFETLAKSPSVYTIGGESHAVIESLPQLSPATRGWDSNRLTADDADSQTISQLQAGFLSALRDRNGVAPDGVASVRFLEKTPKNALRVPFLRAAFPEARFIYLVRDPQESISSIIEAWRSNRFVTYPQLPGWTGPWSLLLIPGWRELVGRPLGEVAAAQWETTNRMLLDDLEQLPRDQWCAVNYADLIDDPQATVERLCRFAGLDWDQDLSNAPLPASRHTLTPPAPNKWRRNAAEIAPFVPKLVGTLARIRQVVEGAVDESPQLGTAASPPSQSEPRAVSSPARHSTGSTAAAVTPPVENEPLKSQHTASFPQLLNQLGVSLLITTYQAGQLVVARVDEHGKLNTHFRGYPSPMGLAADRGRLAIGTRQHVWTLRNQPDLGKSVDPRLDACYVPRSMLMTGDIRIRSSPGMRRPIKGEDCLPMASACR